MDRSPDVPITDASSLEAAQGKLRAEQEAWVQEQVEWEEMRKQVESGLSDLEQRLLNQAKRLRCPRGSEEFEAALQEQLRLAEERQEAAEKRLVESESRREELVVQLGEEGFVDVDRPSQYEFDQLRETLDTATADRDTLQAKIAELEQAVAGAQEGQPDLEAQLTSLREERDDFASQRDEANANLDALAGDNEQIAELRQSQEQLQSELNAERENVAASQQETDGLRSEADSLRSDLEAELENATAQRGETDGLRSELRTERESVTALRGEAQSLRSELGTERETLDSLRGEAEGLSNELADLREGLTAAEGLQPRLEEAEAATAEAQQQAVELAERLVALDQTETELAELKQQQKNSLQLQRDRVQALDLEMNAWETERAEYDDQLAALQQDNEALNARLEDAGAAGDRLSQLEATEQEQAAALQAAESRLVEFQQALNEQAAAVTTDAEELDRLRQDNADLAARIEEGDATSERLSQLEAAEQEQAAALEAAAARSAEVQRTLDEQTAASTTDAKELERLRQERSDLFRELDQSKANSAQSANTEEALQSLRTEHELSTAELNTAVERLSSLEGQVAADEASGRANLEAMQADRDGLAEQLALMVSQLEATAEREAELGDLQGKFDLALTDLQTNREQVAALEAELAARPAEDSNNAGLLQQIAEERDALLRQLEEAAPVIEPSQEMEDLRQRFEMAVDDVRQLKNENQDLNERLATQGTVGPVAGDGWEAQKQRLLASLEGEGESDEPSRQSERASIAGTIQITDDLIAEKDREIERLRTESASAPAAIDNSEVQAAFDADETIQAERGRLAKLESELSDKLRTAELELSVERAKISRAQSELEEQQLELETLRAAQGLAKDAADGVAPRRRWLDKLGLSGEGQ